LKPTLNVTGQAKRCDNSVNTTAMPCNHNSVSQSFQQHFTLIQYIAKIFPRTIKPLTKKTSWNFHLLVSNSKRKELLHKISWQNKLHVFAENL